MTPQSSHPREARIAGALYLLVIAAGIWAEAAVRMQMIHTGDPAATWAAMSAGLGLFRASLAADILMMLADIGLAVLFFALLRHIDRDIALAAMALRLIQAAIIGASLMAEIAALLILDGRSAAEAPAVLRLMELHAAGYDLGLIFFGVNTLLTAWLLARSGLVPGWLPPALYAAGAVYLLGSFSRFLAPELNAAIQPAYLIAVFAESALCLSLLFGCRGRARAATA